MAVSYTTLREFVRDAGLRQPPTTTLRMAQWPPGEVAEIDFGKLGSIVDAESGKRQAVWALVVVLPYSRHSFTWPMQQQTLEESIAGLEAAWQFFGGVPRRVILDNFPAAVAGADALTPRLTRGFLEYSQARGFIADPAILDLLPGPLPAWDCPELAAAVAAAVRVKADVVSADLHESSLREILNYGHTFGHAIEQVHGYRWRHGDAVAVGLVFAAELGERAGISPAGLADGHRRALAAVGLPTTYPPLPGGDDWEALLLAMSRDKKARGATLRFVVLQEVGRPTRLADPDPRWLQAAYRAVRAC